MPEMLPLISALVLVLAAEFVNGWNDAPNAIATIISTKVLSPIHALMMASVLSILRAPTGGAAVSAPMGQEIVKRPVTEVTACL